MCVCVLKRHVIWNFVHSHSLLKPFSLWSRTPFRHVAYDSKTTLLGPVTQPVSDHETVPES